MENFRSSQLLKILVLGGPKSGKTTLIKKLVGEVIENNIIEYKPTNSIDSKTTHHLGLTFMFFDTMTSTPLA